MQSPTGVHDLHFTPPGSVDHRATDRLEPIREPNREAKRARCRFAASPTLETLLTHWASSVLSFPLQITVSG
jgi:hypothetical protein